MLGCRENDRVPNAWIRELYGVVKGLMKGLFSVGSAILKEWRKILLLLFNEEYHAAWGPCGIISPWRKKI